MLAIRIHAILDRTPWPLMSWPTTGYDNNGVVCLDSRSANVKRLLAWFIGYFSVGITGNPLERSPHVSLGPH
jgi:hypothetical protein